MELPSVGVKLVSDLSGETTGSVLAATLRGPSDGVPEVQLKDQVDIGEGALCELIQPRLGREDNHTELTKGEEVHRRGPGRDCHMLPNPLALM